MDPTSKVIITKLQKDLHRLQIHVDCLRGRIDCLEDELERQAGRVDDTPPSSPAPAESTSSPAPVKSNFPVIKDRYGSTIQIGDRVRFLTAGRWKAKEGTVYKITKERVTAYDKRKNSISRSPYNVQKIPTDRQ